MGGSATNVDAHAQFDKLPKRIKTLEAELRDRWLNALSPDELSGQPDWVMDKYFLNPSGKPDRAKTTDVIEIPFPESSSYRVGQLKEAAIRVGVHHATAYGPSTQVVLLGWDQSAVQKAAKQYAIDAKAKHEDEIDRREAARVAKHDQYRARTKKGDATIVGKYIIDCEGISGNWDGCDNLTMSIKATKTPGLYQADFDFGMLEGVMMMSDNESALGVFGCYDSSDEDQGPTMVGFKRKSGSNHGTTTKKIAKATNSTAGGKSKTFFLRMRSAETGEGEINPDPTEGSITVSDDYASFTGSAEMPIVGCNIPFTGRKISDVPEKSRKRWDDYSHAAYEYASSARWQ